MLKFKDHKNVFFIVLLVGSLLIASPLLISLYPSPTSEQFSEFYILDSNRMTDNLPFHIKEGLNYTISLGIDNHRGVPSYYLIRVKLRTRNESLTTSTNIIPSSLATIVEYRIFLDKDGILEKPLIFSMQNLSFQDNYCLVQTLLIDGLKYDVEKKVAWDQEYAGYFVEFFFELWLFDGNNNTFSFNNRWLGLWLSILPTES